VRANVKIGTTLLTDGRRSSPGPADYRHDPRPVGKMAGHIVLPWIHRVFALMKRWGLGTYHGLRRKHIDTGCAASASTPISTSLSSDTIGASTGTSRSKPCSGSSRAIARQVTGISSGATIPAKACRQSGVSRGAAGQRPACGRTDQDLPKTRTQLRFWFDPPALDIDQPGTTGLASARHWPLDYSQGQHQWSFDALKVR
jgi:hypothetical protein